MSTVEPTATPVPVEEVKPTETAPATESSAPVAEAPKVEEAAAPVRFLCWFLCLASAPLTPRPPPFFFFSLQGGEESRSYCRFFFFLFLFLCLIVRFFPLLTGKRCTRCSRRSYF